MNSLLLASAIYIHHFYFECAGPLECATPGQLV